MSSTCLCEPPVVLDSHSQSRGRANLTSMSHWLSKETVKSAATYTAAVLISALILVWALRLWHAHLEVPFSYTGDAVLFQALVKGAVENGWYLTNPRLGMPLGLEMH